MSDIVQQLSTKTKLDEFEFTGFDQQIDWKGINNGHTIKMTPEQQSMKVRGGGLPSDKGARLLSTYCQTCKN